MLHLDPYSLGILLVTLGLLFWLVIRIIVDQVPRKNISRLADYSGLLTEISAGNSDPVILVQSGGKLVAINDPVRHVFHLQNNEMPDLERLARWTRPREALLQLAAQEGQLRFTLDGKLVEGTSYRIVSSTSEVMLVHFHPIEISLTASDQESGASSQLLNTFSELSFEMSKNLGLEKTLQAVIESVGKLIAADFIQVSTWSREQDLLIPYRLAGYSGTNMKLEQAGLPYPLGTYNSGILEQSRKPILISNMSAAVAVQRTNSFHEKEIQSYLAVPLLVGNDFAGTLELGSITPDAFQLEDLNAIQLLSPQAALSIQNAVLFEKEARRSAELSGLVDLSRALRSVQDSQRVFTRLMESIAPLIPVEILGFMIYQENQAVLEAQIPFQGLPSQIVELYRVVIKSGSILEKALLEQDVISSDNASEDSYWQQLGLDNIASAASMHETVLIPLTSGGRMLGYLQASNHKEKQASFTSEEMHFLSIIANQAAPIIENAALVQQTRQRAQKAEALRRIASLASSDASLDEILNYSLHELGTLLRAETVSVFLLGANRDALQFHAASFFGASPQLSAKSGYLPVEDPQYSFTVTGTQHVFKSGNVLAEQAIVPFYQHIMEQWQIQSVMIVPLVVRDLGVGELWLGSTSMDFFDQGDLQAVVTASGQLAGVVDQSYLMAQTDESLRRRIDQLSALTRISREISISPDFTHLLEVIYKEALRTTTADRGTILLFDLERSEGFLSPRFIVGEKHPEAILPLEEKILAEGNICCLTDLEAAEQNFPVEDGINSILITPIYYQQRPSGLIILYKNSAAGFDVTSIEIAQSLASHTSVVISSVLQQKKQMQFAALPAHEKEILGDLQNLLSQISESLTVEQCFERVGSILQSTAGYEALVFSVFDSSIHSLRRVWHLGLSEDAWNEMRGHLQPWEAIQKILKPDYQQGSVYYIPAELEPTLPSDLHTITGLSEVKIRDMGMWNTDDMLLMPLMSSAGAPLGLVSLDVPSDQRRPEKATFAVLNIFSSLLSAWIENIQAKESTQQQVQQFQKEIQSLHSVEQYLPVLLHKDLEQNMTIRSLINQKDHIQLTQRVVELANWQPDRESLLRVTANELLSNLDFSAALIGEHTSSGLRFSVAYGALPEDCNLEALFGQRNPLRQILEDSDFLFVSDISKEAKWQKDAMLNALSVKSFIGLPLSVSQEQMVGLLLISKEVQPEFKDEFRNNYAQMARQISVSLQNLHLLMEAKRSLHDVNVLLEFTRRLESLEPNRILQALMESVTEVVPSADAGWAGLWDAEQGFLVPQVSEGYKDNASIRKIKYVPGSGENSYTPLPLKVLRSGKMRRIDENAFVKEYNLSTENLLYYRNGSGGFFPLSSIMLPISRGEQPMGILVVESFDETKAFDESEEALLLSLTQQAGLALENSNLLVNAEQRAAQLQALTHVAGTITSRLQSEELIDSLLDQLKPVVPYETATLWLKDENVLRVAAASGFSDTESRKGLSVNLEDSLLFQEMIRTGLPISVQDVRDDQRFISLVVPQYFSWLGIPLMFKSELIGVIALEKREAGFYQPEFIQVATMFASQAAIALENARLFEERERRAEELDSRSKRLALLNRFSSQLGTSLKADYILDQTLHSAQDALNISSAAVIRIDSSGKTLLQCETPQIEEQYPHILSDIPLLHRLQESMSVFSSDQVQHEKEIAPLWKEYLETRQIQSVLVVPFVTGTNLYGWLFLQKQDAYRFSSSEIELARTISNQAAISLQNASLYEETRSLSQNLEIRVKERSAELQREHQNTETLLRISNELSGSLDIREVLSRVLGVINQTLLAEQSLIILPDQNSPIYKVGLSLATSSEMERLTGENFERKIAGQVMEKRASILMDNVLDSSLQISMDMPPAYKSVLAVPLVLGEELLGSLLMLHRDSGFFKKNQINLIEAIARQISLALNKAELFNLIRDQAENLGSMLREQQIESNRSRAILEAVADGVVVTNHENQVTLFNPSAEQILVVQSAQVLGTSIESLTEYLGQEAPVKDWMQTIFGWASQPQNLTEGRAFSAQFDLPNGKYVAVSLAPVLWNSRFMGTVTIIRDITHEVQVDRLKSEFITNVSHELRTPMTSIKGYAQVMLMGAAGDLTDQQRHFLDIIASNTSRLGVLVDDLLDVSRIEGSKLTLMFQPLDLNLIAQDVIADFIRRAQEENKPLTIRLHSDEQLPHVNGDPARIRQVFNSLVSNAYNYTPADGKIQVRIHPVDSEVQVDVQDNGVGISPDAQDRIFERFYRGENSLTMGAAGTGLGLSISKTLVEMHLGRIWFSSTGVEGEGSIFSFTLPIFEDKDK